MKRIPIKTGRPYEVLIGDGLLKLAGKQIAALPGQCYKRLALVTDSTVAPLYLDTVAQALTGAGFLPIPYIFPSGEGAKSVGTAASLIDFLCESALTRSDAVVALGGGVAGDLAGFAASIYLRGIDYVQLPTTLLAAVDSSVGGKTAVNIPAGKNLVGSFWQPRLVLCDTGAMDTLPDEVFSDGVAEIIKYGCIWDESLFSALEQRELRAELPDIIARCVEIKAQVVARDEHDHALRQILNFGHTAGHSVEKLSGFRLSHGKGVAIGMCVAAAAGEFLGRTPAGACARIRAVLERHSLPTRCPYGAGELARACLGDKKRSGDSLNLVLLQQIGKALIHPVDIAELPELLGAALEG